MTERINADLSELGGYASKAGGSAERIGAVAREHLAHQQIGVDLLGDLGEESGLHGRIESAISALHEHGTGAARYVGTLGEAVSGAQGDYAADEQLHAESFRRLHTD